jgi:hypothetical protein
MQKKSDKYDEYYEILVQNAQKGETYKMKLTTSPVTYLAIPMKNLGTRSGDKNMFSYQVLYPEDQKGLYEGWIDEIELLEK